MADESKNFDFRDKNVFISGGSRGLGLSLCKAFLERGANVAFCGKDSNEINKAHSYLRAALQNRKYNPRGVLELCKFLTSSESKGITGKLISAEWDNWEKWPMHLNKLQNSDLYTLRRITGDDRGETWGDLL